MRAITVILPWGLLLGSLLVIGARAVHTDRIHLGHDEAGFCASQADASGGKEIRVSVRNQNWIWVSCTESSSL